MEEKILEIKNLRKKFKKFELKDINFEIEQGEIVGLIGRNGAGKTTIIRLIMNMLHKDSGSIQILGFDNIEDEIKVKNLIGYVADDDYFAQGSYMSTYINLYEVAFEDFDKKKLEEYLTKWELPKNKSFKTYSKGMKVKAMLALAMSHNPRILILDEPTAGLDPVSRAEILEMFRDFVSDGEHSVLFSTHITSDLDKVADKIVFVDNGGIIEDIYTDELLSKYVMVSGNDNDYDRYKDKIIGIQKTSMGFSGLALRKNVEGNDKLQLFQPNIESIMVHYIKRQV